MNDFEHKDYFNARYCYRGDEQKVIAILDSYVQNQIELADINRVIELYHTKLFFEKVTDIPDWSEEKYQRYKAKTLNLNTVVYERFKQITEENVVDTFNNCYVGYWDDFRNFFYKFNIYKCISKNRICDVLKGLRWNTYHILQDKSFVEYFDEEITILLEEQQYGLQFVVSYYLEEHDKKLQVYIPRHFTIEKRVKLIEDYLKSDYINPNFMKLILNAKHTKELPITPKMKKMADKRNNEFWENNKSAVFHDYGFGVTFGSFENVKNIQIENSKWMQINEENYRHIRDGIPVKVKKQNGQIEEKKAIVIDFTNPENNDFLAIREMKIHGDLYRRRTDIVGFVNGIPLLFIELKKNSVDVQNAYTDNYTDYLDTIPHLFYYNAFLMLSNGTEAKVGTLGSKYEFFHEWKRLSEQEEGNVALETMLRGICKKDNFLDLLENFILFDHSDGETVKILARNHQYLGVNEAVKAYEARKLNNGKLGVFWHTQGSGKSYSMVFLSQKIRRKFAGSPTIVILTDRDELNTQISDTFENCGLLGKTKAAKYIATSGDDLITKLQGNPSFIFTLIQKFNKKDVQPIIPDHDIIIIQNIINSCYAVKMELPEYITDHDSFFEDLGFPKEAVRNRDVRIIKSNSRHITISYGDKSKEIEKGRLEKYKVTIQTKCVVLKIKALWNSSENNLYGIDKKKAIKCIPDIENYEYVPVNNSMLAKAEIPFLIFERNRGKCFVEMY